MVGQKEVVRQRNWFRESRLPRRASLDLEEGSASIKVSHLAQVRLVGRIIGCEDRFDNHWAKFHL